MTNKSRSLSFWVFFFFCYLSLESHLKVQFVFASVASFAFGECFQAVLVSLGHVAVGQRERKGGESLFLSFVPLTQKLGNRAALCKHAASAVTAAAARI